MSKIVQTKQQRKNTLEALNVMWPSVPPENVIKSLQAWRGDLTSPIMDCGSVGCFGGWCSVYPPFAQQGIEIDVFGIPKIGDLSGCYSAQALFGHDGMFQIRGYFPEVDYEFKGTDHELVTHRLQWLLENSEVQP